MSTVTSGNEGGEPSNNLELQPTTQNTGDDINGILERQVTFQENPPTNHSTGDDTNGALEHQVTFQEQLRRGATNSGQYYPDEKNPGTWPNNLVGWQGPNDPQNPMNWKKSRKITCTMLLGFTAMGASFASSSFSPTFVAVSNEFGVSTQVSTLSLSIFVLGFAFGPLVSARLEFKSCRVF